MTPKHFWFGSPDISESFSVPKLQTEPCATQRNYKSKYTGYSVVARDSTYIGVEVIKSPRQYTREVVSQLSVC